MTIQTNLPPPKPVPITITTGMSVVCLDGNAVGQIQGITQGFCVYTLGNNICVEPWSNIALTGVCPARPLLPSTVDENDRLNASARVLGELLLLKSLGDLTPAQTAALAELLELLCPTLAPHQP